MDYRIPLASVLLMGGAVGLMMPSGAEEGGADSPGALASQETATLAVAGPGSEPVTWAEEVALDREHDGHFYADVVVDGVPTRMLVDTGASVVAITGEDAMAMGLRWDDSEVAPVAQGASGVVYGVNTQLQRVSVGGFEASEVAAVIIPEGLGISLLGQSFLSTVESVQIADDRMVLAN